MRLSRIEKMRQESAPTPEPQVLNTLEQLACAFMKTKALTKTQREYIFWPGKTSWFTGPIGTGKTNGGAARVIIPGLMLPGSMWFICRAVKWTLEETTLKRFDKLLLNYGKGLLVDKQESPIIKRWLAPAVRGPDGKPGEPVELIFHSLDELEKLGGTEFTGVLVDEANEITVEQAATLDARLRWALPGQERPMGPFYLNFLSNPVRRSHWLHKRFCGEEDCDPEQWGRKFLATKEENEDHLPPGYYEDRAKGMTPEMRLRFIEGQCGPDPAGEGIFSAEFDTGLHVRELKFDPKLPMIRGWDFGRRRPACVWAQKQRSGAVWRLAAQLGNNESLDVFATKVLMRSAEQFPGVKDWLDFCDPHGDAKKDVSEKSSFDILREKGINPRSRHHSIELRLQKMSEGLRTMIEKKPRSLFDRTNCQLLIEGYGGGYCWPPPSPTTGQLKDKPLADGWYEHPMDADGYIEVGLALGGTHKAEDFAKNLRKIRNPFTGY